MAHRRALATFVAMADAVRAHREPTPREVVRERALIRAAQCGDPEPLRLLARHMAFTDPVTGQARTFISARTLAWPDDS